MLETATRLGLRAAAGGEHAYQLAAILVRGSRIISIGVNRNKTDPMFVNDPVLSDRRVPDDKKPNKLHCEMVCVRGLPPETLKGAEMIILRISKKKGFGMARPCKYCMAFLVRAQVKKITYTEDWGGWTTEKL